MSPIVTNSGYVACTPFVETGVKSTVKRGIAYIDQQQRLTKLYVVYAALVPMAGSDQTLAIGRGDIVHVPGDLAKSHASQTMTYEGEDEESTFQFVLVPVSAIRLFESVEGEDIPAKAWPSRKPKPKVVETASTLLS